MPRIDGFCVKTIWDCISAYHNLQWLSDWTRHWQSDPTLTLTKQHYRWQNFGAMRRSELLLFIRSQQQKAARFQQLYHWNLFEIATKHHHNSECLDHVCCDHNWYCHTGDGGQSVLRDPQAGSLHHRHQRTDGWTGGDGTQSQITWIL